VLRCVAVYLQALILLGVALREVCACLRLLVCACLRLLVCACLRLLVCVRFFLGGVRIDFSSPPPKHAHTPANVNTYTLHRE